MVRDPLSLHSVHVDQVSCTRTPDTDQLDKQTLSVYEGPDVTASPGNINRSPSWLGNNFPISIYSLPKIPNH